MFSFHILNLTPGLICLLLSAVSISSSRAEVLSTNCTEVLHTDNNFAYSGWSYTLSCNRMVRHYEDIHMYEYDEHGIYAPDYHALDEVIAPVIAECLIIDRDRNDVLVNSSFNIPGSAPRYVLRNFQPNSSVNFEIILKVSQKSICLFERIRINVTDLIEESCAESRMSQKHNSISSTIGNSVHLGCDALDRKHKKLLTSDGDRFSVRWFRNCTEVDADANYRRTLPSSLQISKATWQHPGIYSCAVTHNGQTMYVVHHRVCFEPKLTQNGQNTIKCSTDVVYTTLGQKAVLQCTGTFGEGKTGALTTNIHWEKISGGNTSKIQCKNPTWRSGFSQSSQNANTTCEYKLAKTPCFFHTPSKEEGQARSQEVFIKLTIKNVKPSDLAKYVIVLSSWTKPSRMTNTTVTLKVSAVQPLLNLAVVLGTCVGFVCFLIMVGIVYILARKCKFNLKKKMSQEEAVTDTESI